jgi:hypothetical protein
MSANIYLLLSHILLYPILSSHVLSCPIPSHPLSAMPYPIFSCRLSGQSRTLIVAHMDVKNLPDLSDLEQAQEQSEMDR